MENNVKYSLRNVSEADFEFIYDVKKEAYRKYVEMHFGGWDEEQQRGFFKAFIDRYISGAAIIVVKGVDVGFFNGEMTDDGYEIGNICIVPEYQCRGIGSAVLKDIIEANHGRRICLRFFKSNPAGRLYERLGFRITGETAVHFLMTRM